MTTIASDGMTIAADGLGVWGTEITDRAMRKIKIVNGTIYAFTGSSAFKETSIAWHQDGCQGDPPRVGDGSGDAQWSLYVVRPEGMERFSSVLGKNSDVFPYPFAAGSGSEYAKTAMVLGKSPREAVEVAASLDVMTGGEITVINIAEALGLGGAEVINFRAQP